MRDLLSIGTSRGCEMIGTGIGLGLSGYRFNSPWVPTKISGIQLWLDASDPSTVLQSSGGSPAVNDGDPVGYWADKSGKARHLSQTDGTKKPALKLAIKNGKNVVRWDSTNDALEGSDSIVSQPDTIFIVASNKSTGYFYFDGTSNPSRQAIFYQSGKYDVYAGTELLVGTTNTNYKIIEAQFNGSNTSLYVNSSLVGSGNSGSGSLAGIVLGNSSANAYAYPLGGDIAEVLIYDSILSASDRALITNYLNSKWSIY